MMSPAVFYYAPSVECGGLPPLCARQLAAAGLKSGCNHEDTKDTKGTKRVDIINRIYGG
jgi:hypothetical protein